MRRLAARLGVTAPAIMFLTRRPWARRFPDDFEAWRSAAFSLLADSLAFDRSVSRLVTGLRAPGGARP